MESIVIRPIVENELPVLEWEGEFIQYRNLYRQSFVEMDYGRRMILVACQTEQIIGQIFIQFNTIPADPKPDRRTGYLYSFRVRPEFRNQGVGSSMILAAEEYLHGRKFKRALICAAQTNQAVLRLYARLGYNRVGQDSGKWSYMDHRGQIRHVHEPSWVLAKRLA